MTEGGVKMDMSQLIKKAARQLNIKEDDARLCLDTFVDLIFDGLQKGDEVSLSGFGDFCLEMQNEIENEIPCEAGHRPISMRKAKRKVVFVPSRKLESIVNRW